MARPIKDMVVLNQSEKTGFDCVYINNIPKYQGTVSTLKPRTGIDKSEEGLTSFSIARPVRDKYNSISITGECFVNINGSDFPVSTKELRIAKALVIEQVNRNEEYSFAVAFVFSRFALYLSKPKRPMAFEVEMSDDMSDLQKLVIEEIVSFIDRELTA